MRFILLLFTVFCPFSGLYSQTLQEIEIQLSDVVAEWQQFAIAVDAANQELKQLRNEEEEMKQAAHWLALDLKQWKALGDVDEIKRTKRAYRKGKKRIKRIGKNIYAKHKAVNDLAIQVAEKKTRMDYLSHQKDVLLNGDDYDQGKIIYSGYFPEADKFYFPAPEDNLFFHPPSINCKPVFDGIDPMTQKHRIDQGELPFFRHQPEGLPLINGHPYLSCNSSMTLVEGGMFFLNLSFLIQTKNARKSFGYLERKSRLVITFVNGEELTLLNNILNLGVLKKEKGRVLFRGQYSLSVYAQNMLRKMSIDKIMIEWAKGYEYYDVYNVDLLKNQFNCL